MTKYVLGMDGGGTKTHCALFDIEGNKIDMIAWGPTNHEVLKGGLGQLEVELKAITNQILVRNNISIENIENCVFGLAGVDTKEQHRHISGIIKTIGINKFILCNDAYLGIKSGSPIGQGICVINGTGCCVAGIDKKGMMLQVGGLGYLTGDIGGGAGIGEIAVQTAYNYLFRCGEYTELVGLLFEILEVKCKFDFIDQLCKMINLGEIRIADLNKLVFKAANSGDKKAIEILEGVGKSLASSVNGIIKDLEFGTEEEIHIILAGTINLKGDNPRLIETLKDVVISKNRDKKIKIIKAVNPPVIGAVIWALEGFLDAKDISNRFFLNKLYL